MSIRWYILNVYSGFEDKVVSAIWVKAKREGLEDAIKQMIIPVEDVIEVRQGSKVNVKSKFFPGYILIQATMSDEIYHVVMGIPKVSGFLGVKGKPSAVSLKEIDRILKQIEAGIERPRSKINFEIGDEVAIIDGPFVSFNGFVEEVSRDQMRLKISVSIFGRTTPVELDYLQVKIRQ